MQVGREPRAAFAVGPVAIGGVRLERTGDEVLESVMSPPFARSPDSGEPGRPGRRGLGFDSLERETRRHVRRGWQRSRRRQRSGWRAGRQAGAPERREDGVRSAIARTRGEGLGEQASLRDDDGLDAAAGEGCPQGDVVGDFLRLQPRRPDHGRCRRPLCECGDDAHRVAAFDEQPGAEAPQVAVQAAERAPKPPARRAAGRPCAARGRFPHMHREESAAAIACLLRGGEQCRIVAEPQVAAQPEDRRGRCARACHCRRGSSGRLSGGASGLPGAVAP